MPLSSEERNQLWEELGAVKVCGETLGVLEGILMLFGFIMKEVD